MTRIKQPKSRYLWKNAAETCLECPDLLSLERARQRTDNAEIIYATVQEIASELIFSVLRAATKVCREFVVEALLVL